VTWLVIVRAGLAVAAAGVFAWKGLYPQSLLFLAYAIADGAALWMTLSA
jgi:hypothetical protein